MTDKRADDEKKPEPGSAEDLLPKAKPTDDPAEEIEKNGEPEGGGNFA